MNDPMVEGSTAGRGAMWAGLALIVAGLLTLLAGSRPASDAQGSGSEPPVVETVDVVEGPAIADVQRRTGEPYEVVQRVAVHGPLKARQHTFLHADAIVRVDMLHAYRSTITTRTERELVEVREITRSGVLAQKLELTDHSLKRLLENAERLGLLASGDPLSRAATGAMMKIAARLLESTTDRLMQEWLEGKGAEELKRVAGELGVEAGPELEQMLKLPASLAGMEGRRYELRYRVGEPPAVRALDGGPLPAEIQRFFQRTSFFLDAEFYRRRDRQAFDLPARDLQQYFLAGLLPTGPRLSPQGTLHAELAPVPVRRPRDEPMREFRLSGRLEMEMGSGDGTSGTQGALVLDRQASYALFGLESGYLRDVELVGDGSFAGWVLARLLGLSSGRRIEGKVRLDARQRCSRAR